MKLSLVGLAVLLTLVTAGCQFESDFSGLKFVPDTLTTNDAKDLTQIDQVGPDSNVPDTSADTNTGSDVVTSQPTCMEFLNCLLFKERCQDVSDQSCPNVCADSDAWKDYPLFDQVYVAMGNCQIGGTSDAVFLPCLYSDNAAVMTACLGETPVGLACSDAVICMLNSEPACNEDMQPKPYFGCLGRCASGISAVGQKGLSQLLETCLALVPAPDVTISTQMTGACSEALQECFGGSGSRTCHGLVSCISEGCLECSFGSTGTVCDAATCLVKCLAGASSEKAVELALGSVAAGFSSTVNVFTSFVVFTQCLEPGAGTQPCGKVYDDIKTVVKSGDPHLAAQFDKVLDLIAQVQPADLGRLRSALGCLEEKLSESAFVLDALDWPTCRLKCN